MGKFIKDDMIEAKRNENVGTQSEQRGDTLRDFVLTLTYIVLTIQINCGNTHYYIFFIDLTVT